MAHTQTTDRQSWLCPFEAAAPDNLRPFCRPPTPAGYEGPPLTVCPGYTSSLPETIEIARAWGWAERGELRSFCGGPAPAALIDGVDIFVGAIAEFREWKCSTCSERKE